MPTSTFFRLPEEKRQRLLDAAREEFSQARFSDVSINRLIQNAHIPRGSFYQYFADKEDLFGYLMSDMRDYFYQTMMEILAQVKGDLFAVPLSAYDRLVGRSEGMDPVLSRCIAIVQANPQMDSGWMLQEDGDLMPEAIYDRLDLSRFRQKDRTSVDHVFFMIILPLAHAIMKSLCTSEQHDRQRKILQERVELVKYGILTDAPTAHGRSKEDTKC